LAIPVPRKERNMAHCVNCGKKISDGVKFCPSCGAAVKSPPKAAAKSPSKAAKGGASAVKQNASPQDEGQNNVMAIIAYVLFFVPLISGDHKKSPFVKFHTNQGTVLAIAAAGLVIVWLALWAIITAIFRSLVRGAIPSIYVGYRAVTTLARISSVVTPLLVILILALLALGILHAVKGTTKPLPLIGKFEIIK
jgi:uncharacterized membrane protein